MLKKTVATLFTGGIGLILLGLLFITLSRFPQPKIKDQGVILFWWGVASVVGATGLILKNKGEEVPPPTESIPEIKKS